MMSAGIPASTTPCTGRRPRRSPTGDPCDPCDPKTTLPSQLHRDILDPNNHRPPCPRELGLHGVHDLTGGDDLRLSGDHAALARPIGPAHPSGGDEQLDAIVLFQVGLGLVIVPDGEGDRVIPDSQSAHVVAPVTYE